MRPTQSPFRPTLLVVVLLLLVAPATVGANASITVEETVYLASDPWDQCEPAWSPDGQYLAYISRGDLYVMNANGSGKTAVFSPSSREHSPAWANNQQIIFASDQTTSPTTRYYNLLSIDCDTREVTRVLSDPLHQRSPTCNPYGQIAYLQWGAGNYDLWTLDPETGTTRQVTATPGSESAPMWSPTDDVIAYAYEEDIWLVDGDGSNPRRVTDDDGTEDNPAWSPGGGWIAYESNEKGSYDIWAQNLETGEKIRLTSSSGDERNPAWSPGGGWIAYESNEGTYTNLMAIQVRTPETKGEAGTVDTGTTQPTHDAKLSASSQPPGEEKIFGFIPIPSTDVLAPLAAAGVILIFLWMRRRKKKKLKKLRERRRRMLK